MNAVLRDGESRRLKGLTRMVVKITRDASIFQIFREKVKSRLLLFYYCTNCRILAHFVWRLLTIAFGVGILQPLLGPWTLAATLLVLVCVDSIRGAFENVCKTLSKLTYFLSYTYLLIY